MKKDAKTMKEVAERCTKYCRCDNCNCSNSSKDDAIYIDLYEEIVENHDL